MNQRQTLRGVTVALFGAMALGSAVLSSADSSTGVAVGGFKAADTGEQKNIVQQGVYTASASGSYFTTSGNHTTNLSLAGSYFYLKNVELRAGINYTGVNSNNNTGFSIGGRYYFDVSQDKQLLPFAGVFYQYNSGTGFNSNAIGGELGVQYFLVPNVSITPTLVYNSTHTSGSNTSTFGIQFGLTYWFK